MRSNVTALEGHPSTTDRSDSRALHRLGQLRGRRTLLALPLALLAMVPATSAIAAEPTTNYHQTPPPPKTETTPTASKTTPAKQEVAPTQEETTRHTTPSMTSREVAPSREQVSKARVSKLPFTGLDLRWVVFGGVLLLGSGLSILLAQRRRHSGR
jgi:uncharacterized membrane protein